MNAKRERVGLCITCAGRLKAKPCAAAEGNAAATSVSAMKASLARSTGRSVNVTTSPVPDTRAFCVQVSLVFSPLLLFLALAQRSSLSVSSEILPNFLTAIQFSTVTACFSGQQLQIAICSC